MGGRNSISMVKGKDMCQHLMRHFKMRGATDTDPEVVVAAD